MKILALDPGYDRCGMALLERTEEGKELLLDSTCVTTNKQDPFEKRLFSISQEFKQWILTHKPDICVLEKLFFATNQKTAMHVAEVRGALILAMTELSVPLYEFTPKEVKVAVTGDGSASKKQVMLMVSRLIHIEKDILFDDEYDAIAVGLTASASLTSIIGRL